MNEAAYTNRELDLKFDSVKELMDAHFDAQNTKLDSIDDKVTKTNGTVRWHTKLLYLSMGALPLLTIWAMWLTNETLNSQKDISPIQRAAIGQAIDEAFRNNTQ